jgi:catechol 2,3-dioxygenase-like lactoylglutathione lyase family enzyme
MSLLANAPAIAFVLVRDRARAKGFYGGTLGLRQIREDQFATVYDLNGISLRLTTVEDHTASPHTVLGWAVKDIVSTVRTLKAAGVSCTVYPGFGQDELGIWTSPDGEAKVVWFPDPEGNVLSLTEG